MRAKAPVQLWGIFLISTIVWGKGALEEEDSNKEKYEVDARDPVPASQYLHTNIRKDGFYDDYDLGYYASSYAQYKSFILSADYYAMKRTITNKTLVCVNFEASVNGTYLGVFTCPLPGLDVDDEDLDMCCGGEHAEFCCYDTSWLTKERLYGGLALGGTIILILIIGVLCYVFLGKRG